MSIIKNITEKAAISKAFKAKMAELTAARDKKILEAGGRTVRKVPAIEIDGYKMLFVPSSNLIAANFSTAAYNEAAMNAVDAYKAYKKSKAAEDKDAYDDAKAKALAAFSNLRQEMAQNLKAREPLKVDRGACIVHTARRSLASDIAGVEYGGDLDHNIIMVQHDAYHSVMPFWGLGRDKNEANALHESMVKNLIFTMCSLGIDIVEGPRTTHYDFWASSSSHQKVGVAYFGEAEMMKRTWKAREFGRTLAQLNEAGGDNGSEYIKREALLFTPSQPIDELTLDDILMVKDVKLVLDQDNVADVNLENADITYGPGKIERNVGDGQNYIIVKGIPSFQGRAYGPIKGLFVQAAKILEAVNPPEFVKDYDGIMRRIRDYKVIAKKSSWKGTKLGYTWAELVSFANVLRMEGYKDITKLRVVRYCDSAEENDRYLSRQSTQQWIYATDRQISKLTAASLRELKRAQKLSSQVMREAQLAREENDRDPEAAAYLKRPDMIASETLQAFFKHSWQQRKIKMAANKLRVRGQYPYIIDDPVADLKMILCGADPHKRSTFIIKPCHLNAPNLMDGQKIYFCRYPNNFLCGMVLMQQNDDVFSDIGNILVLAANGVEIVRADGDNDGDEGLVCEDMIVVNLMETVIRRIDPPLISFPHGTADRHDVTEKQRILDIVEALYNGQAYNLVGMYSNIATKEMALDCVFDPNFLDGIGKDVIRAHVATILVIDMVKTGVFPRALKDAIEVASDGLPKPYSQIFVDMWKKVPLKGDYNEPGNGVADRIAKAIVDNAGEYEFDPEGVMFDGDTLLADIPEGIKARRIPKTPLNEKQLEMLQKIIGNASEQYREVPVSAKEMFVWFFNNRDRFQFVVSEDKDGQDRDMHAQRTAYERFVHDFMLEIGNADYWLAIDKDVRRRIVYNAFISDAFEFSWDNRVANNIKDEETRKLIKACYARFVIGVFSDEIVEFAKPYDETRLSEFASGVQLDEMLEEVEQQLAGLPELDD